MNGTTGGGGTGRPSASNGRSPTGSGMSLAFALALFFDHTLGATLTPFVETSCFALLAAS